MCGGVDFNTGKHNVLVNRSHDLELLTLILALAFTLGQQNAVNVRQHSSLGNHDVSEQLAQLLVIPDGELDVPGDLHTTRNREITTSGLGPNLAATAVTSSRAVCETKRTIRDFLLSRAALPASSRTSAARYSRTEARYTGAPPAPIQQSDPT